MRTLIIIAAVGMTIASTAVAQEEMRSLGKHEHGHGTLNMAIEGKSVLIEFHAPGADIVGFEHPARTEEDKAAVGKAVEQLKTPLTLFALPADAGCRVEKAHVSLEQEDGHDHAEKHEHEHAGEHAGDREDGHTEFHAEYALTCDRPENLRRIAFPYFHRFAGSRELDVTVIDDRGQTRYEVERDNPAIDLKRTP